MYCTTKKSKAYCKCQCKQVKPQTGEDICNPLVAKDQYPVILPVYVHDRETVTHIHKETSTEELIASKRVETNLLALSREMGK